MKLHHVTISNLNSLYGEHTIDFERDLEGAPLFLIQGKTGAGKSTILDAICLCLFGATPRLARGTGRPDEDARHIMSYGTGSCFASLVFSIRDRDGQRRKWRAKWECRRARNKPGGNLQDPDRSVWRLHDDGREEHLVTDSRRKYFDPHFESVLEGMQIEDFQRSVLLAQGQFAAFLKASEHDKATILERLTDTTEYKVIGERAAAKRKEIKQELDALELRLEGLPLLTDQEERELSEALSALNIQIDTVRADLGRAQRARDLLAKEQELQGQLTLARERHDTQSAALTARALDLGSLTKDRLARPHEPPLHEHIRAQESLGKLVTQITALEAAIKSSTQDLESATKQDEDAQRALLAARDAMEGIRPKLEAARALAGRAAKAREEHELATTKHTALLAQHQDVSAQHQKLVAARQTFDQEIDALETSLKDTTPLVDIAPQLPALEAKLATLQDTQDHVHTSRTALKEAKARAEKLKARLEEKRAALLEANEHITPLRQAQEGAKVALDRQLGDARDAEARRAELDASREDLRQHAGHIDQAIGLHDSLVTLAARITQTRAQEDDVHAKLEQCEQSATHLQSLVSHTLGALKPLEHAHHELDQILLLADKRRLLKAQDPCPLCGSKAHPFLSDKMDQFESQWASRRDGIARQIHDTTAALEDHRTALRDAEIEQAALQSRIDSIIEQRATLRTQATDMLGRHNGARHRAGLDAIAADTFPLLPQDQAALRHALEEARGLTQLALTKTQDAITALGASIHAEELANRALTKAEQSLLLLHSELDHTMEAQTTALHAVDDATKGVATWTTRADTLTAELSATLHAHKLAKKDTPITALPGLLQELKSQVDARARVQARFDQKRTELDTLARDLTAKAQTLEGLEAQHQGAKAELERRQAALDAITHEQSTLLDGATPEALEAHHKDAITTAQTAQAAASTHLAAAQTALATCHTRLSERERVRDDLEQHAAALLETLDHALKALGLVTLASLQAMLLPVPEREALEHDIGTLERGVEHATLDITRLGSALATHQAELADQAMDFLRDQDLEAWRGDCSRLREQLEVGLGERGAMDEKVRIQQEAVVQAAAYKEELAQTRKTFGVWETLFKLIGRKDGDSFKLFAQSLNLQELIDRANHRLAKLNPRYALAAATGEDGEPVLDFAVCDHHQADTRRPLTTLSGGETFLVSLALALALADFRRLDMPIETLLLDEGFGTLDQSTLDTAMATLRQLQQENLQQVGIISHVEVLKERVEARIVVEKLGNGRSTLRVEHGAGR